jgi:hypothetical protein
MIKVGTLIYPLTDTIFVFMTIIFSDPIPKYAKQGFHVQGGERGCHGRSILIPIKRTHQRYRTSPARFLFHQHF